MRGLICEPEERYLIWLTDMFREADKNTLWLGKPLRSTEQWLKTVMPQGVSCVESFMISDIKVNLLSDLLVKMDMATMASSLEARSPLLDHVVAEFTARLPADYLLRRGRRKALLRDAYRGKIPDEVLDGPKRGFSVPLGRWMKHDLRVPLMDTLGASSARVRVYLDGPFVDKLLDGRIMQDRNWALTVYALLVLELWLGKFA
jgi:asparagine synthase (glutamine-hydrolysing)